MSLTDLYALLSFLCIILPHAFLQVCGISNSRCSCPTRVPAVPLQPQNFEEVITYSRVTHIPLARFSLQGLHLPENGHHWMSPLIPPSSPAGHSYLVALYPKLLSVTASHCPFLLELNTSHYRSSKMRCLIEMYVLFIFIIVVLKDIKRKTWKFRQIFHLKPVFKCPHATCNLYEMFLTFKYEDFRTRCESYIYSPSQFELSTFLP